MEQLRAINYSRSYVFLLYMNKRSQNRTNSASVVADGQCQSPGLSAGDFVSSPRGKFAGDIVGAAWKPWGNKSGLTRCQLHNRSPRHPVHTHLDQTHIQHVCLGPSSARHAGSVFRDACPRVYVPDAVPATIPGNALPISAPQCAGRVLHVHGGTRNRTQVRLGSCWAMPGKVKAVASRLATRLSCTESLGREHYCLLQGHTGWSTDAWCRWRALPEQVFWQALRPSRLFQCPPTSSSQCNRVIPQAHSGPARTGA